MPNTIFEDGTQFRLLAGKKLQFVRQLHLWVLEVSIIVLLLLVGESGQPSRLIDFATSLLELVTFSSMLKKGC